MIVAIGGCAESREAGCLATCEYLTSLGDDFRLVGECMNEPRRGASCFRVGRELVAVGGCSALRIHLGSAEVLTFPTSSRMQPEMGGWESVECVGDELPSFSRAASCQLNHCCLLFGGYDGLECLDGVYALRRTQSRLSVQRLTNRLPCRLKNSAAVPVADESSVYLFGGWDEKRTLNTVIQYSLGDGVPTICSLMPTQLEGHTATVVRPNQVVICGGYDGVRVRDNAYMFHQATQEWTVVGRLEHARENHAAVFAPSFPTEGCSTRRDVLLILGGWNGFEALDSCEAFEVLDASPWLVPLDKGWEVSKMKVSRNKPVAVFVPDD